MFSKPFGNAIAGSRALASQQEYTPFGSHRGIGDITQTTLDYTGQQLGGTGLLYYHAHYYDPLLGRFVSPDTIVPGADTLTLRPGGGTSGGPANLHNLNRYTYVTNNPLSHTDLGRHCGALSYGFGNASDYEIGSIWAGGGEVILDSGGDLSTVAQAAEDMAAVAVGGYLMADAASDTLDAPDAGSGTDAGSMPLKAGGCWKLWRTQSPWTNCYPASSKYPLCPMMIRSRSKPWRRMKK